VVAARHGQTSAVARPGRAKILSAVIGLTVAVAAIAGGLYCRSHRSQRLTEQDTIVLADFSNSSGDAIFDDTLKTALSVSLRQSPFLNVLSKGQVAKTLKLMMHRPDEKLTPTHAIRAGC
jgi:eukaryotic-like serine/threonine-protein kinase